MRPPHCCVCVCMRMCVCVCVCVCVYWWHVVSSPTAFRHRSPQSREPPVQHLQSDPDLLASSIRRYMRSVYIFPDC
jgi:hypothetical protein